MYIRASDPPPWNLSILPNNRVEIGKKRGSKLSARGYQMIDKSIKSRSRVIVVVVAAVDARWSVVAC